MTEKTPPEPADAAWVTIETPFDAPTLRAFLDDVERLFEPLEQSLYRSGFMQPGNPRRLMERMRRLFGRSGLEPEEINVLRGMLAAWDGTAGRHGS